LPDPVTLDDRPRRLPGQLELGIMTAGYREPAGARYKPVPASPSGAAGDYLEIEVSPEWREIVAFLIGN